MQSKVHSREGGGKRCRLCSEISESKPLHGHNSQVSMHTPLPKINGRSDACMSEQCSQLSASTSSKQPYKSEAREQHTRKPCPQNYRQEQTPMCVRVLRRHKASLLRRVVVVDNIGVGATGPNTIPPCKRSRTQADRSGGFQPPPPRCAIRAAGTKPIRRVRSR